MLRTIFGKTLFEKRWTILIWFAAALISIFGISMIFPPIRDTMGSMMAQVPQGIENWFGESSTWQTFEGFAGMEVFGQMAILLVVMAIVFGAALLAGDEASGTLLTVLSRPVRRSSVFWQKYLAFVAMLAITAIGFYGGAILGGWALGEAVSYDGFALATLMVFLLSLALGSLAYAIGAITGRKALAGLIVGFYAFVAYFIASLSTATEIVDKLSYGTLFRYADAPAVLANGLDGRNVLVLSLVSIVPLLVAWAIFIRRDLRTR
ncbi:MAG: ABC transporter permease [Candidatus Nomurabacteria bacterium]|jgi:ABC-2 type transport system permease protein|nr:ABC transporter permease [Candidatus Nomurabacteria bacterium]